jgi:hypothetical protein
MAQYLQVNGDYNIKTKEGGQITLDTGPGVGDVRVTGNLVVVGDTLTVSAENLNVQDNIIVLNYGELGPGVTLEYSGIEIDRGDTSTTPATVQDNALLIYNENTNTWEIAHGNVTGTISFSDSNLKLRRILVDPDIDNGDLTLIGDTSRTGVIKIGNANDYAQQVRDREDNSVIPNKKYVDDAIRNNPTYQIVQENTRVVVFDVDDPLDPLQNFPPAIGPYTSQPTESLISVIVDNNINSVFYDDNAVIQGLQITGTEVTTYNDSNVNIFLRTEGTGKLQTNYGIQLDKIGVIPGSVEDSIILYTSTPGLATTGVYFVNSDRSGELINKNKALLFSMIF